MYRSFPIMTSSHLVTSFSESLIKISLSCSLLMNEHCCCPRSLPSSASEASFKTCRRKEFVCINGLLFTSSSVDLSTRFECHYSYSVCSQPLLNCVLVLKIETSTFLSRLCLFSLPSIQKFLFGILYECKLSAVSRYPSRAYLR